MQEGGGSKTTQIGAGGTGRGTAAGQDPLPLHVENKKENSSSQKPALTGALQTNLVSL